MKLINMDIPIDLSSCAIEHGLKILQNKNLNEVKLLCSNSYGFQYIFKLLKELIEHKINFLYQNVDSSEVLPRDAWMLIDNEETIFYSPGA